MVGGVPLECGLRADAHSDGDAVLHALTDAIATAELLQAQVAGNYGPETPIGMLWS